MRLRKAPPPDRNTPLDFLTIDESIKYVLPRIRAAADPNRPGSYIRINEWGARWNPWGEPRWFETTYRMRGLLNRLPKGVIGEYRIGHLGSRYIGHIAVAETAIAYEVENGGLFEPLEIAALGIAKYLDGHDSLDDKILKEVEVPDAMTEDRRRNDEMVRYLLYGDSNE